MTRHAHFEPGSPCTCTPAFEIRESFWGYIVRRHEGPAILVQVTKGLVLSLGLAFLGMAAWTLTRPENGGVMPLVHIMSSAALIVAGLILLRFGARGAVLDLHLDVARGELREIVNRRADVARVPSLAHLDPSVSLNIERRGGPEGQRVLVLHQRGECQGHCLARGPEPALRVLRQRITHDVRIDGPGGRVRARA